MVIGATQCLFIIVLITALIGLRGWVREVVTMAIVLGVILFLSAGGDGLLHQFIFVNLPDAFRVLLFGDSAVNAGSPTVSTPNPTADGIFRLFSFAGLMGMAYLVGHRYGTPPKTNTHKVLGIIPGAVTGMAMAWYVTNQLYPNTTGSPVQIFSPTSALDALYLPIILGFALLALVIVLIVSAFSRRGAKG